MLLILLLILFWGQFQIRLNNKQQMVEDLERQRMGIHRLRSLIKHSEKIIMDILYLEKTDEISLVLEIAEDFQSTFDAFEEIAVEYEITDDLSFIQDAESNIIALRGDIIKVAYSCREGEIEQAKKRYINSMVRRFNYFINFCDDSYYSKDIQILAGKKIIEETKTLFFISVSIATVFILILNLFINRTISRLITVSLNRLIKAANEIKIGNLKYKIKEITEDELGMLATTFNTMTGELSNLFDIQKKLLEESKRKNEELQTSEEELFLGNEELKAVNDELARHKENLEEMVIERTQAIKESEEELRQNVEELRVTQDQMRIAKEYAEEANKAKSEFLANMSHEIRTPLNAIVGFSQILMKRGTNHNLSSSFMSQLENIKTGGQNLSELINNILDLSKIESGKMSVSFEPLNIRQLFQGIYHINKGKANEQNLNFSYDFDSLIPEVIESDRTKLNQILMNLTSNSIKFTPKNRAVKLSAVREDKSIIFKIIDNGIGIPKEKRQVVFEAFEQADTSITRRFGGSGLGLAITKRMVDLLKGEIWFESELNKGTTFFVKLPLIESKETVIESGAYAFSKVNFSNDNIILIAEDNQMNRDMMTDLFKELNLKVHFAVNGLEAIEKTKELNPDIILMDMHMPEMGGLDATKSIRSIDGYADLPIVALSAEAFSEQQKYALSQGLTAYITKPLDFNKLMPLLEKYLKVEDTLIIDDSDSQNQEITDEIKDEIINELNKIFEIPSYNYEEFDEQFEKIRELYKGYDVSFKRLLNEMEDAVFASNNEQLKNLVNKAIEKIKNGN
jgi:signal transduction histidine kinase/CheY-like chemotaxis protein